MDLKSLVEERLNGSSKCSGHCQETAQQKFLMKNEMLIGCYACPSGYVSFLVQYGKTIDFQKFKAFVSSLLEEGVADEDIRIATRYDWDLGIKEENGVIFKEAYWRQSYRRTSSADPDREVLFSCTKCGSFYRQPLSGKNVVCPDCREDTS